MGSQYYSSPFRVSGILLNNVVQFCLLLQTKHNIKAIERVHHNRLYPFFGATHVACNSSLHHASRHLLGHMPTYMNVANNMTRIPAFTWLYFALKCIPARCTTLKIQCWTVTTLISQHSLVCHVTRIPAFTGMSRDPHPSIHWYVTWPASQHSLVRHVTRIPASSGTSCDFHPSSHWFWHHWYNIY